MANARNNVQAGDYLGKPVACTFGTVQILTSFGNGLNLGQRGYWRVGFLLKTKVSIK